MYSASKLNELVAADANLINSLDRLEAQYTSDVLPQVINNFDEVHSDLSMDPFQVANSFRYRFMMLSPTRHGFVGKNWYPDFLKNHSFLMSFVMSVFGAFLINESFTINFSPCLFLLTEDDIRVSF